MSVLFSTARWGHFECMKLLLERGAAADVEDMAFALSAAARIGHLKCMKLLFEYGAGTNSKALSEALSSATCCCEAECLELLLEWGAKISISFPYRQKEFLNFPIYLFSQLILQENLEEHIREEMKKRLKKERESFIEWKKELKTLFICDVSYLT